jgi:hypothetical protein
MSSQAAGKRAKASERTAQQFQQQSQQAIKEFREESQVPISEYRATSQANLQQLDRALAAANIATPGQLMQTMEQFAPGSTEQRRAAGQFIQELLSPEITAGERRQLRKEAAEAFGGGYRIPMGPTPFESIAQNQYTTNMEQLIRQRRAEGANMAQTWNTFASNFVLGGGSLNLAAARYPFEARESVATNLANMQSARATAAANLATGAAADYYKAQENAAEAQYQANMVPAQTVTAATGALAGGLGNAGMGMMLGGGGFGGFGGAGSRIGTGISYSNWSAPALPTGVTPQMASWRPLSQSTYGR